MNNVALSPRKERYAQAYVQHHNSSQAARDAGYSCNGRSASVTGTRLLADVCVLSRIEALEAANAVDLGVSRQRFLYELKTAAELARERGELMALISALREIGKACGYYQPERLDVALDVRGEVDLRRMNQMSDADLIRLIQAGQAAAR